MRVTPWALILGLAGGCAPGPDTDEAQSGPAATDVVQREHVEGVLSDALQRVRAVADSVDALFRPVPLLTPAQEAVFQRYGNAQQLARAQALGVQPRDAAARDAAVQAGRLVVLEDSTALWVVRELTHSEPLLTPDARALLVMIGERFQSRLAELGAPAYRVEVTSVLRTAESQAELRRTNPNAAAGQSTHEYGTTLDIAYNAYAAPATPDLDLDTAGAPWLQPYVETWASALLETVAARNGLELRAILGRVMAELQAEGAAMVTLERQQPVYHFTVARRLAAP
jgi:hypothetical protein